MRTESLTTLGSDETGARAAIEAAGGKVSYQVGKVKITWLVGSAANARDVITGNSAGRAPATCVVRSRGIPADPALSAKFEAKRQAFNKTVRGCLTVEDLEPSVHSSGGLTARLTTITGLPSKEIARIKDLSESTMSTIFESLFQLGSQAG